MPLFFSRLVWMAAVTSKCRQGNSTKLDLKKNGPAVNAFAALCAPQERVTTPGVKSRCTLIGSQTAMSFT